MKERPIAYHYNPANLTVGDIVYVPSPQLPVNPAGIVVELIALPYTPGIAPDSPIAVVLFDDGRREKYSSVFVRKLLPFFDSLREQVEQYSRQIEILTRLKKSIMGGVR